MSTHTATHPHPHRPSPLERWALPLVVALAFAALVALVLMARPGNPGVSAGGTGSPAPDFSAVDVVSGLGRPLALRAVRV